MENSNHRGDGPDWAINGRFVTQRMTGVQRYAHEIVTAPLDEWLAHDRAAGLALRLVVPPTAEPMPSLARIGICRTRFGSGHAWDQFVLPLYARSGLLQPRQFRSGHFAKAHCLHSRCEHLYLPELFARFQAGLSRFFIAMGRQAGAQKCTTVSRFSADMLEKYGVCRGDKIFIAPNGHEHVLRWDATRAQASSARSAGTVRTFVGQPRQAPKGIDVVLDQARALDQAGIDVVVVGGASSIFAAGVSRVSNQYS